jgi:hypothetical protein
MTSLTWSNNVRKHGRYVVTTLTSKIINVEYWRQQGLITWAHYFASKTSHAKIAHVPFLVLCYSIGIARGSTVWPLRRSTLPSHYNVPWSIGTLGVQLMSTDCQQYTTMHYIHHCTLRCSCVELWVNVQCTMQLLWDDIRTTAMCQCTLSSLSGKLQKWERFRKWTLPLPGSSSCYNVPSGKSYRFLQNESLKNKIKQ